MLDQVYGKIEEIARSSPTVLSGIYAIILLITGAVFVVVHGYEKGREHLVFSCRETGNEFDVGLCREKYNIGPNELQSWLVYVYFAPPLALLIIEALIRKRKVKKLTNDIMQPCRLFHIHVIHFLRLAVTILLHLTLSILLVYKINDLTVESNYNCLIGNSTLHCIDPEATSKSNLNISCFSFTIFLLIFVVFEIAYTLYKWRQAKAKEGNGLNECKNCRLFDKMFSAGMLSLFNVFRVE